MFHRRFTSGMGTTLLALSLGACRLGEPSTVLIGAFEARTVNGAALPGVLFSGAGFVTTLVSERLKFIDGQHVDRTYRARERDGRNGDVREETVRHRLEYRLRGSRLEVGYFGPTAPNESRAANYVYVRMGDRLVWRLTHPNDVVTLVTYERSP